MDFPPLIVFSTHMHQCAYFMNVELKGANTEVEFANFAMCNFSSACLIVFPVHNYIIPSNENISHSQSWSEHANMEPLWVIFNAPKPLIFLGWDYYFVPVPSSDLWAQCLY